MQVNNKTDNVVYNASGAALPVVHQITNFSLYSIKLSDSTIIFPRFSKAKSRSNLIFKSGARFWGEHKFVRLILEYAAVVWSPLRTGGITKLESVQRHFTKWISGLV